MRRFLPILLLLAAGTLSLGRAGPAGAQTGGGLSATIAVAPTTISVGQPVSVTYTVPPSGTAFTSGLTTSSIDFGDGQTLDGGSVGPGETVAGSATHTYADPGTYTVTITAQDPNGATGSASATVTVVAQLQPPAVQIQGPADAVQPGAAASFTYSVTPAAGASVSAITIDYGDGSVDNLSAASGNVSHTYASAGAYAVLLTATDSSGQVGAATTVVQVGS